MTSTVTARHRPPVPFLALVLAVVAVATGCASPRSLRPAAVQPQQVTRQVRAGEITAATQLLTDDARALRQKWEINRAQQRSIASCMHRLGYRYLALRPGRLPTAAIVTADVAGRSRYATYGVPLHQGGPRTDPEDAYLQQLPSLQRARYGAVLLGTKDQLATITIPWGGTVTYGTGGCLGAARRRLFGSLPAFVLDSYLPQFADMRFDSYLASSRPYMVALRGWRQCMATTGKHFASPAAAVESVEMLAARRATTARALAADQRAVAGADAACGARSGLRRDRRDGLLAWLRTQPSAMLERLRAVYLTRQRAVSIALRGQHAAHTGHVPYPVNDGVRAPATVPAMSARLSKVTS
ncbi:MAG TPA: hypothetical protein VFQ44_10695 [Streptosporangiaceae bacterium]|nr:hypothetical protein [Streptosporangiaceae bacterium]